MFGGIGPAIGNHWGIGSLTDEMYDDAIVGMRASAQKAIDDEAMLRLSTASQASAEWVQRQADMFNKAMLKDESTGRYDDTFRWKELSFKEKLQEETDEWLDKVLD